MRLNRSLVIQTAAEHGLTALTVLTSLAMNTQQGACRSTLDKLGETCGLDRHTVKLHLAAVAAGGSLRETGTRSKRVRRIVQNDGVGVIDFDDNMIEKHMSLGDGLALAILCVALCDGTDSFVVELDTLQALADVSRDTLWKVLDQAIANGLVQMTRENRSFYRIVPRRTFRTTGTLVTMVRRTEKHAEVRSANAPRRVDDLQKMALAAIARLKN